MRPGSAVVAGAPGVARRARGDNVRGMDAAPSPPAPRPPWRRLAVILGVWAWRPARRCCSPRRSTPRWARATATPPSRWRPTPRPDPGAGGLAEGLPPLTLILDRQLPAAIADQPPIRQAALLEARARRSGAARDYVELGTVLQTLGDAVGATAAYRSAIRAGGDDTAAEAGLALVEAGTGAEGPARAAQRLDAVVAARPRSQLAVFNRGWLAIYRSEADIARASLQRTVALGPDTRLGRVARALIASLGNAPSGRNP